MMMMMMINDAVVFVGAEMMKFDEGWSSQDRDWESIESAALRSIQQKYIWL